MGNKCEYPCEMSEIQRTEGSIPVNPVSAIHPGDGLVDKVPNLRFRALCATIEVLAGEFGDQDGELASVLPEVLHVSLKVVEVDVVPMDANVGGFDADLVEEILHPIQAVGCGGGRRRAEDAVALILERGNVRVPHPEAFTDVHEGLAVLVDPAKRRK